MVKDGAEDNQSGVASGVNADADDKISDIVRAVDGSRDGGTVRISDRVLGVIAGIATTEIEGVADMSGNLVDNLSEKLGRHDLRRGVKVKTDDETVTVNVSISVNYGCRIPQVAREVQRNVKEAIENMTDLTVNDVNVHVEEVIFPPEDEEVTEEEDGGDVSDE